MHKIEKLNEKLLEELGDYSENGKFSKDDTEIIKNLSGAIDHICNIMEDYDDDEYSGRMSYARDGRGGRSYRGGSYRGGNSYDDGMTGGSYEQGGSYARDGRGRGSNARRDSMGRYSSRMDGYSRHGDVVESLREVMEEAPDERTRQEIQRLIEKMEQR